MSNEVGRGMFVADTLPMSPGDMERLREMFNTYERVHAFIVEYGLDMPSKVAKPPYPTGAWASEAGPEEYGSLFTEWVGYHSYLLAVQAHVHVHLHRLRTQAKHMYQTLLSRNTRINRDRPKLNRLTQAEIDTGIQGEDNYVSLQVEIAEYEQKKTLIDAAAESAENTWRMLSRQIEIRKMDGHSSNAGSGVLRRPLPARQG